MTQSFDLMLMVQTKRCRQLLHLDLRPDGVEDGHLQLIGFLSLNQSKDELVKYLLYQLSPNTALKHLSDDVQ